MTSYFDVTLLSRHITVVKVTHRIAIFRLFNDPPEIL